MRRVLPSGGPFVHFFARSCAITACGLAPKTSVSHGVERCLSLASIPILIHHHPTNPHVRHTTYQSFSSDFMEHDLHIDFWLSALLLCFPFPFLSFPTYLTSAPCLAIRPRMTALDRIDWQRTEPQPERAIGPTPTPLHSSTHSRDRRRPLRVGWHCLVPRLRACLHVRTAGRGGAGAKGMGGAASRVGNGVAHVLSVGYRNARQKREG